MVEVWKTLIRSEMHGWFNIFVPTNVLIKMFVMGVLTYLVVAMLEFIKIKRIPMDIALKNED